MAAPRSMSTISASSNIVVILDRQDRDLIVRLFIFRFRLDRLGFNGIGDEGGSLYGRRGRRGPLRP